MACRSTPINLIYTERVSIEPRLLRTFVQVVRSGSISGAAQVLHRSQPAVSVALRRLESVFGEPLLSRGPRGVRLTALGERVLPHAEALELVSIRLDKLVEEVKELAVGPLRIAASTTIAHYWLPPRLVAYHASYPAATSLVHTRNSQDAIEELARGDVDLALVESPESAWSLLSTSLIEATVVHDDELVVVLRPDHPLSGRGSVAPEDLQGERFVGRERGSGTRDVLERVLRDAGVTIDVRLELGESQAIKAAVRAGLGISVLSSIAVTDEVTAGTLVAVRCAHPGMSRSFTLLRPPPGSSSRAAAAFGAVLRGWPGSARNDGRPPVRQSA